MAHGAIVPVWASVIRAVKCEVSLVGTRFRHLTPFGAHPRMEAGAPAGR